MNWRRNANSLSQSEKNLFIKTVKALKTPYNPEPPTGPTNRYNEYVAWHQKVGDKRTSPPPWYISHTGPALLPWHREFIRKFELDLQNIQTGITLPYWNWAQDSGLPDPKSAPIWKNFMGGDGDQNNNNIVKSGDFSVGNWVIADEDGRPVTTGDNPKGGLQRELGRTPGITTLPTMNDVNSALGEFPYDAWPWNAESSNPDKRTSFRNKLEGFEKGNNPVELHNRVHLWVGGSMIPFTSPNDPVFFLHHCYLDRIWDRWQVSYRGNFDYPADNNIRTESGGGERIVGYNRNDVIYPWNETTIGNVLDSPVMGVEYDPGNHAITAVAVGSSNVLVFWIGSNGSVNYRLYRNSNWEQITQWAGPGSAAVPSGSITAISDMSNNKIEFWWTKPDSSVVHTVGGFDGGGNLFWGTMPSKVNYSSTSSGLAALFSKTLPFMFSVGCDSKVYWAYWNGSIWPYKPLTSMTYGSTSSGLAAVTRSDNYMDIMWIEGDGSVKGQSYSYSSNNWSPYTIAAPGSAWGNSLVAVSRDTDKIDVWWIGPTSSDRVANPYAPYGSVYTNSLADGQWKGVSRLNSFPSIRGGLAAVVRSPTSMELYFIDYQGAVYNLSWDSSNGWVNPYQVAGPGSASTSSGLTAVMRDGNNIDILWIEQDKEVSGANLNYNQGRRWEQSPFDPLTSETPNFNAYAASTGLPSDG